MSKHDGLDLLVAEGIIDAVHARLMSGKEATVYIVERAGHLGAAKVYKARDERTFKKTASYVEGRNQTRNTRDRRAMSNKSVYGRGLIEENWQTTEFRALAAAFDAGVRVPEPFFLHDNTLFMELVVDGNGAPASRLVDFSYTPEEATALHHEIFRQVHALLGTGRVHGDLSAYNVLMAAKGPTIIDLPQVVDVARNNNARAILRRDLRNVTEHLARFDARLLRLADCGDALFEHLARGTLADVTGPEPGAPASRDRGGRRGRDADRGRVGREKGQRAAAPAGRREAPADRPADRPPDRPVTTRGFGPPRSTPIPGPRPPGGARPPGPGPGPGAGAGAGSGRRRRG
jgi:RIO kinase 1